MSEKTDSISVIVYDQISFSDSESLTSNSFISKFLTTGSPSDSEEFSNKVNVSVVVKSTCQDYTGLLAGLENEEDDEKHSESLAITTAKASLVEQKKKEFSQEIFNNNAFAVPGRFHCKNCDQVILSIIKYSPSPIGFWKNLQKLFKNRCCAEKTSSLDIVHECPLCQTTLIRITES
jgi:hypothetical protein